MSSAPELQLHDSTVNLTDRTRIDEANQQLSLDLDKILGGLSQNISQGLGLYSNSNTQGQFNAAFQNAQDALNNYNINPGNVDLSNYQPYMNVGSAAANQAANLLGFGTNPMNSQQIYDQYLNNPAVQAQLALGQRQVMANASAQGLVGSGAMLKALQSNGQGIAAQNLGQMQSNLYNLAALGAQSANQYAASLLNKYSTDQQTALGAKQNQTNLIGQQANLLGTQNNANNAQIGLLTTLGQTGANIAGQAALARQSSLAGSATKSTDTYGMGYGGIMDTKNTSFGFGGTLGGTYS